MQKNKENFQWRDSSPKAVIPFMVFVLFYFGFSVFTRDFSKVPMTVAFIISSATALTLNHKEKLTKKIEIFALGMGKKDIMIMCMIFILAGAFTSTSNAIGSVNSAVVIAQNIIPVKYIISGVFIISALISLAIGTSCGTIAAIVPIAVNLSSNLSINPSFLLGAAVGGAMLGDNLSLISDTTIAAARTQNVPIKNEVLAVFKIVITPAIVCALFYLLPFFINGVEIENTMALIQSSDYIKILPYILLLVFGIMGMNVMFLLLMGIILNIAIGIYYSAFDIYQAFSFVGDGTVSMANTIIVAMLAGGLLQMIRYNGGINFIIDCTCAWIKSGKTCQFGICILTAIINLFTANNTVAIITSGPIAKELSEKYNIKPARTASLINTTSCCIQGLIPYGAQILIAAGLAGSISMSSFSVMQGLFYPIFIAVGVIVSLSMTKE